jgi:putative membrane protein
MIHLLLVWIVSALALMITAYVVPGFKIHSFGSAMWASVIVGLLNMLIRPILLFLTLPINFLTLGLFTFVVNAIVLRMAAGLLKGFDIDGWGSAIVGAVVLVLVNYLFLILFGHQMEQPANV